MAQPPAPQVNSTEPRNGYGITALVLAITGIVLSLVPLTGFVAVILGALAVLFACLGWGRVKRRTATNKRMTLIGGLVGVATIVLGAVGMMTVFSAVQDANDQARFEQECADPDILTEQGFSDWCLDQLGEAFQDLEDSE